VVGSGYLFVCLTALVDVQLQSLARLIKCSITDAVTESKNKENASLSLF